MNQIIQHNPVTKSNQRYNLMMVLLIISVVFTGCSEPTTSEQQAEIEWTGTWSTAQQLTEPRNNPPSPGLEGNTLRQVVHVSIGGNEMRLRLSNAFGTAPVELSEVHVAKSAGAAAIESGSDLLVTFSGDTALTMQPGEAALSDPFEFDLEPLSNVAITMHFNSINDDITGHPGSRTTSYIKTGRHLSDADFDVVNTSTDHWYIIDALDVMAPDTAAAVAMLGNSITDGRGSGTNKQNRWPDELSRRFQSNEGTRHIAVLNQGIGGNCVLKPCLGPAGVERFERDVINQTDVKWLIVFEGINDIGGVRNEEQAEQVAADLIAAYQDMIEKGHQYGIKVYGATLMPFGSSFYDRPASEQARQQVNEWIRSGGAFDAVIDLDKALEDPENPGHLLPEADDGDGLHPSERGHEMIAEAIELSLFMKEYAEE